MILCALISTEKVLSKKLPLFGQELKAERIVQRTAAETRNNVKCLSFNIKEEDIQEI